MLLSFSAPFLLCIIWLQQKGCFLSWFHWSTSAYSTDCLYETSFPSHMKRKRNVKMRTLSLYSKRLIFLKMVNLEMRFPLLISFYFQHTCGTNHSQLSHSSVSISLFLNTVPDTQNNLIEKRIHKTIAHKTTPFVLCFLLKYSFAKNIQLGSQICSDVLKTAFSANQHFLSIFSLAWTYMLSHTVLKWVSCIPVAWPEQRL